MLVGSYQVINKYHHTIDLFTNGVSGMIFDDSTYIKFTPID